MMKRVVLGILCLLLLCSAGLVPAVSESAGAVYASNREEAYEMVLQRYQKGMAHYARMQEEDNSFLAEGEFNSPLYFLYRDITGDGQPELLFLASRDDTEEWPEDIADLFIYTWEDDHAELILRFDEFYAIAGNGPWYEIYQDGTGSGDLYMHYGCDSPGSLSKYQLGPDGHYTLFKTISAYIDPESDPLAIYYYVDGREASREDYEAAEAMLSADSKVLVASTSEVVSIP